MKLPAYLDALNLAALPIDYEWDNIIFNTSGPAMTKIIHASSRR